ncbi:profilin-like [Cyclopterus lumpus]|uniref:Profilin n=1 Tax=Cyclopterus lumpus TaxID=8103 RepID=A0A8C2WWR7_CYCLU|nr:profilin-like [Cyclopterus lumpus]
MSWDLHLDRLKVETVTEAGIFGLDGSIWASTEGLKNVTGEQIKILAGESAAMYSCGPKVGAMKCVMLKDDREDLNSLCLHLKTSAADGNLAVCVGKSIQAIVLVIGTGAGNQLSIPVYQLVSYLRGVGY